MQLNETLLTSKESMSWKDKFETSFPKKKKILIEVVYLLLNYAVFFFFFKRSELNSLREWIYPLQTEDYNTRITNRISDYFVWTLCKIKYNEHG